jgi:hypothetical protein
MTHLTSDELIDAMEAETLTPERQAHLASCATCQQQLTELTSVLSDARQTSVPEPSPLFWPHFSERVRTAIDHDPAGAGAWPAWLRWQTLLPLGAVAMIILALASSIAPIDDAPEYVLDDSSPSVELPADNWLMVAELVGDIDIDTASAAGVIEPGVAEQAVLQLTAEEQQELTRLLKAELMRAKS